MVVDEAAEVAEVVEVEEKEKRAARTEKRKRRSSAKHGPRQLLCIYPAIYEPNRSRKLLIPGQRSSAKSCGILLLKVGRL